MDSNLHLLSGVDISAITLWLGYESPTTTHMYVEAALTMKEKALENSRHPHLPDLPVSGPG
jgi:hypothetical protein